VRAAQFRKRRNNFGYRFGLSLGGFSLSFAGRGGVLRFASGAAFGAGFVSAGGLGAGLGAGLVSGFGAGFGAAAGGGVAQLPPCLPRGAVVAYSR